MEQEYNIRGNLVERGFAPSSRHAFDFSGALSHGWHQCDTRQDAHYYGNWCNPRTLQMVSYTEGDIVLITCETWGRFLVEIKDWIEFQHKWCCFDGSGNWYVISWDEGAYNRKTKEKEKGWWSIDPGFEISLEADLSKERTDKDILLSLDDVLTIFLAKRDIYDFIVQEKSVIDAIVEAQK